MSTEQKSTALEMLQESGIEATPLNGGAAPASNDNNPVDQPTQDPSKPTEQPKGMQPLTQPDATTPDPSGVATVTDLNPEPTPAPEPTKEEKLKAELGIEGVREVGSSEPQETISDDPFVSLLSGRLGNDITPDQAKEYILESLESRSQLDTVRDELKVNQDVFTKMQEAYNGLDKSMLAHMQFKQETGITNDKVYTALKDGTLDGMGEKELIQLAEICKNPAMNGIQWDDWFGQKFMQNEESFDESQRNFGKIEMTRAAGEAKQYLESLKSKIKDPETIFNVDSSREETSQKIAHHRESWNNIIQKAEPQFTKFQVSVGDKFNLEFDVSPDMVKHYQEEAIEYATEGNVQFEEAGYNDVAEYVYNRQLIDYWPKIAQAIYNKGKNDASISLDEELTNPSAKDPTVDNQQTPYQGDVSDQLLQHQLGKM